MTIEFDSEETALLGHALVNHERLLEMLIEHADDPELMGQSDIWHPERDLERVKAIQAKSQKN